MSSYSPFGFGLHNVNSRPYMDRRLVNHNYIESETYTFYWKSVAVFKVKETHTMYNSIYHNHQLMIVWSSGNRLFVATWDTSIKGINNIELKDKIRYTLRNPGVQKLKDIPGFEHVMEGSYFLTTDMVLNEQDKYIKPIRMILGNIPCWNMSGEDANTLIKKHKRLIIFREVDDTNRQKASNLREGDVILCIWGDNKEYESAGLQHGVVNFIPYNINEPLSNHPWIMKGRLIYGVNYTHDTHFVGMGGLRATRYRRTHRKRTHRKRAHRKRTHRN